eukprot:237100_1
MWEDTLKDRQDKIANSSETIEYLKRFIGIITLICSSCLIIILILICSLRKEKIHSLERMHRYLNNSRPVAYARKKSQAINQPVNLMQCKQQMQGRLPVSNWQPEAFSDMLDNTQMIEQMIVDDIVGEMHAEGAQNDDQPSDSEVNDGTKTTLPV